MVLKGRIILKVRRTWKLSKFLYKRGRSIYLAPMLRSRYYISYYTFKITLYRVKEA